MRGMLRYRGRLLAGSELACDEVSIHIEAKANSILDQDLSWIITKRNYTKARPL
jgi:hypothetical protein